jgi:ankyrin repeat protein
MTLPRGIDLDQYKTQAKELLKETRAGRPGALARLRQHHPEQESLAAAINIRLADAQLVIAKENGFPSWARFKEFLLFRNAVKALDSGDLSGLETLLEAHPFLLRYQCRSGTPYEQGYFAGATLLHHVAGNPDRGPLPRNILAIARLLVSRNFDPEAAEHTIGLLLTSKRASEGGVALALIDLLAAGGARSDLTAPDILDMPLLNMAPATGEALVRRGVKMDIRHAAALGKIEALKTMLAETTSRALLEEALAYACIRGQKVAASLLLQHGAKGDVLVTPGRQTPRTALHEAANRGYLDIVKMLLERGACATVVEPHWRGTPAGWAEHGGHPDAAALLKRT